MSTKKFHGIFLWTLLSSLFLFATSFFTQWTTFRRQQTLKPKAHDDTLSRFFDKSGSKTIIGFGSLLSETSSRMTFPTLTNFRIVRITGYRRIFRHPAGIFFERAIANLATLQISSLSTEAAEGYGFLAVAFSVPDLSPEDFLKREEEFNFEAVNFTELSGTEVKSEAIMCISSTDEVYVSRWGQQAFHDRYTKYGLKTIWGYEPDSGILPCSVYLRHCYLAAQSLGRDVLGSFLDDTYLADRVTTIRSYLSANPEVLLTSPPPSLVGRYSG